MYILYSNKLDKYYVGSTRDINDRISRHNRGTGKFTATGIPWNIVYSEKFEAYPEARAREMEVKREKSRNIY